MKKYLILLFFFPLLSFGQKINYGLAEVGFKIHGVYVFIKSEPVNEYIDIATIKVSVKDTKRKTFEKAIKKARGKYHNFNGMIFRYSDLSQVDLIRFKGLDVYESGVKVFDKVMFADKFVFYGTVIELLNDKYCRVSCLNKYGEKEVRNVPYGIISVISDSSFNAGVKKHLQVLQEHNFEIGERVAFVTGYGTNKNSNFGKIIGFSRDHHKAKVQVIDQGEVVVKSINILDLTRAESLEP